MKSATIHPAEHPPATRRAPVLWFAAANIAASLALAFGMHALVAAVSQAWWLHAAIAPVCFAIAFLLVHHAGSFVVNLAVQWFFARVATHSGRRQNPASPSRGVSPR
jgi:hypothetical protein